MAGQIHKSYFWGGGAPPWQARKALKELSHFHKPLGWFFIHKGCVSVGVIIYVPDQCFGLCPAVQVQTENINPKFNGVKPAENC